MFVGDVLSKSYQWTNKHPALGFIKMYVRQGKIFSLAFFEYRFLEKSPLNLFLVSIEQNNATINVIEGGCYSETLGASRDFLGVFHDDKVEFR